MTKKQAICAYALAYRTVLRYFGAFDEIDEQELYREIEERCGLKRSGAEKAAATAVADVKRRFASWKEDQERSTASYAENYALILEL